MAGRRGPDKAKTEQPAKTKDANTGDFGGTTQDGSLPVGPGRKRETSTAVEAFIARARVGFCAEAQ